MSTITETETENKTTKRVSTSMFLDRGLWLQVRTTALNQGITTTKFVETALVNQLAREAESKI